MLRKLFVLAATLSLGVIAYASVFDIQTTSFTATADTNQVIYSKPAVLYSVCVDSSSAIGGAFSVFNSTSGGVGVIWTTATIVDTSRSQVGCYNYNIYLSSGLMYTNSGSTPAKMNLMWNPWSH